MIWMVVSSLLAGLYLILLGVPVPECTLKLPLSSMTYLGFVWMRIRKKEPSSNKVQLFRELRSSSCQADARSILAYQLSCIALGLWAGLSLMGMVGGAGWFALLIFALLPQVYLREYEQKRQEKRREVSRELPDFALRMQLLLNTGLTAEQALERSIQGREDLLSQEIEGYLRAGVTGDTDLEVPRILMRNPNPDLEHFFFALAKHREEGGQELAYALAEIRRESEEREERNLEVYEKSIAQRLLLPNLLSFFALLLMILIPMLLQSWR